MLFLSNGGRGRVKSCGRQAFFEGGALPMSYPYTTPGGGSSAGGRQPLTIARLFRAAWKNYTEHDEKRGKTESLTASNSAHRKY